MSRRDCRVQSFILIYQHEFHQGFDITEATALHTDGMFLTDDEMAFVKAQTAGTIENLEYIDGIIRKYISGWTFERISKIDTAILRLSIYELAFMPEIPTGVSINEAVEIAKQYGTDEAPAFVNGLLSSAVKEIRGQG